jgi:redox-sensitive bicupin YhaK (pirin superfamily)
MIMTKAIIHRASSRGVSNLSWMKSYHSFSYGQYFNPIRMQFGKLRVLNDERIQPNRGFSSTPLDNMEMVTIVLDGELKHTDTLGNDKILKRGGIQCLSGGSGVKHSELNNDAEADLRLLHMRFLPKDKGVAPQYNSCSFDLDNQKSELVLLVGADQGLPIAQDACVSWGNMEKNAECDYKIHYSGNGLYLLVIEGMVHLEDHVAFPNDAIGVWTDEETVHLKMMADSKFILIEMPPKR